MTDTGFNDDSSDCQKTKNDRQVKSQLLHPNYLQKFGIAYNTNIACLICLTCSIALAPGHMVEHIKNQHGDCGIRLDQKLVDEDLALLMLSPQLPLMDTAIRDEILGLSVHSAWQCNLCNKVYGAQSSMLKHHNMEHNTMPVPTTWTQVYAQRLNHTLHRSFFPITPALQPIKQPAQIIIHELRSRMEALDGKPTGHRLDPRLLSPWLKSNRWSELIKNHSIDELLALVAPVKTTEFPRLVEAVHSLFLGSEDMFSFIPELILQRLNSPDPAKDGINNQPFHCHQDHIHRMKEYTTPVVQLLAMLLRPSTSLVFPLSSEADKRLNDLRDAISDPHAFALSMKVLRILIALWTHTWTPNQDNLFPDPTIVCLALMMLQPDGSFKHPKYTTGPIARFEYCMRNTFMIEIYRKVKLDPTTSFQFQMELLAPWFTEKYDSTFNSLRSLQHRATAIAESTMALPRVWWLDRKHYQTMLYEGCQVTFSNIQCTFVKIEHVLIKAWQQNVLCGLNLHAQYNDLADDLTNTAVGYSFITDPRNPFNQHCDSLITAILKDPLLRKRFIAVEHEDGTLTWNKMILRSWLYQYAQFEGLLLVRGQMLGGAPGRGTELTAMTYTNIATSTHRNCVAFGKYLAMLVTYHKGTALTGSEKLIPHAFDGVTSDLIIQNLAIARPFAQLAAFICHHDSPDIRQLYRDHLFVNNGKLFTSTEVSRIMQSYTEETIGVKLGLQAWRQVSIAFRRKLCSGLDDLMEIDEQDTISAQQATHSRRTENRIYGLSADALSGVAEDVLPLYLDASTDWQIISRAVPGGLGLAYYDCQAIHFDKLVQAGAISPSSKGSLIAPTLSATKITAEMTSAITEQVLQGIPNAVQHVVTTAIEQALTNFSEILLSLLSYYKIKLCSIAGTNLQVEIQDALKLYASQNGQDRNTQTCQNSLALTSSPLLNREFISEFNISSSNPAPSESSYISDGDLSYVTDDKASIHDALSSDGPVEIITQDISSPQIEKYDLTGNLESAALAGLCAALHNPQATWSSPEQKHAVIAVLQLKQDVCAFLRTGAGKTMLAIIPALIEGGQVTVVILPLKSLISDYKRKLKQMKIPFEHYTGAEEEIITGNHALILVSADRSRTPGWRQTVARIHNTKKVNRFIFDEGQLALTDNDFRPALQHLEDVRTIPVQLVVLSATIPIASEKALAKAFGLTHDWIGIRMSTDRPELEYIMHSPTRSHEATCAAVLETLHAEMKTFTQSDRALIFVSLKEEEGRPIVEALGCDFYEGGESMADQKREAIYHRWIQGIHKVMVCTNAFGAGNDYPNVRLVIHAGTPKQMIGFTQEVGRAGRDGQWAKCVIIPRYKSNMGKYQHPPKDGIDHRGYKAMWTMIYRSNHCIRYSITSFTDKEGMSCGVTENSPRCSRCLVPAIVQCVLYYFTIMNTSNTFIQKCRKK
ncbi:hypothetical protein C0989_001870 [Termitomyces sp. Mn162]|nr:hypothetical protein C0989_001870 [Termitomyces sp. Mn162]